MTFIRLSHRGAVYDPRTLALLIHYTQVLGVTDLWSLVDEIQQRVFAEGAGGLLREGTPEGDVWRLTEWGELTVIEIIRIATTREWALEDRAGAIRLLIAQPRQYDALVTGAHA